MLPTFCEFFEITNDKLKKYYTYKKNVLIHTFRARVCVVIP